MLLIYIGLFLSLLVSASDNENNWAILIDTSSYWFNYRHASNVLGLYSQIRSRGIPDSRIILMVAEDIACNARNVFPGTVVNNELKRENLVEGDVEIDYRGAEVSVDNLIRLLTNRHTDSVSRNKILNTNHHSKIFLYLTGHGGENFMKFRNVEEVSAHDLSAAFNQMWQQGRYKEILFVIDTCQAASMFSKLVSPNIYGIASSKVGESSYSYTVDSEIGLSVVDRFSHKFFEFLKSSTSESTIQDFINDLDPSFLGSTPIFHGELFPRPADQIKIWDFLSGRPINRITLDGSKDSELFKFLDTVEETPKSFKTLKPVDPPISVNVNNDKRRIYSLKYDHDNVNDPFLTLIIIGGTTLSIFILYYVNLIKM